MECLIKSVDRPIVYDAKLIDINNVNCTTYNLYLNLELFDIVEEEHLIFIQPKTYFYYNAVKCCRDYEELVKYKKGLGYFWIPKSQLDKLRGIN